MTDEKIIDDINGHIHNIEALKKWFETVYYDREFSTIFNRPVISMLIAACDYLSSNLLILKQNYIALKS